LIQPVSVVGIYGLDLVIMFTNYGLALFLIRIIKNWSQKDSDQRLAAYRIGFLTLLVLAFWIGSSQALFRNRSGEENTMRVAAIQPGLPLAAHMDKIYTPEERIQILSDLTLQAAQEEAELIVWPEMGLGFDPQQEYTRELLDLAEQAQAYLVMGYVVDDQIGFRNQAVLLSPAGEFMDVYSKTHPMLASGEPRSQESGRYPVVDTPIGRVGMMICFDNSFTDVARALGKQKVQVIANPSLLGPSIAELMTPMGVFRSLENRSAVIMADTAYKSVIFDFRGRVVAQTPDGISGSGILVAEVLIGNGGSVYSVVGDFLGWACLLCLAALAAVDLFRRIVHS
jgi:apolipoprotein N-acyltransferase